MGIRPKRDKYYLPKDLKKLIDAECIQENCCTEETESTPQLKLVVDSFIALQPRLLLLMDDCIYMLKRVSGVYFPDDNPSKQKLPIESDLGYIANLSNICANMSDIIEDTQVVVNDLKLAL